MLNWHLYVLEYVLQAVIDRKITRLIINIGPRYSKTEQAVINFIARGLALNSRAKFMHVSYSDNLVLLNSSTVKDIVSLPEYQRLWPMKIRSDSKSKRGWFTDEGGGMFAVPSGGQMTGLGAGRMASEKFSGAFIIDDPVKPDDAYSDVKRSAINNRFNNTMRSRLADETIPMIVIMQRIHENDMTGYLLKGGSGDKWHHLLIPAYFSEEVLTKPYSEEYTHGIPISINGILKAMKSGDPYAF